jgi:hypothetical protein
MPRSARREDLVPKECMDLFDAFTIARKLIAEQPDLVWSVSKKQYVGHTPDAQRLANAYNTLAAFHSENLRNRVFYID